MVKHHGGEQSTEYQYRRVPWRKPPREQSVSVIAVRGLLEAVESLGGPRELLVQELGGCASRLHVDEARVPFQDLCRICERAIDVTDAALGLRWAERLRHETFSPVSHMLAHVQSLRHAFELLSKFGGLFSDEAFFSLNETEDTVVVCASDWMAMSPRLRAFSAEVSS